jgi:redox-sensitive bicupin YhaK (pirin superfamily)
MVTILDAKRHPMGALAAPLGPPDAPRSVGPFCMVAHVVISEPEAGALPVDHDVRAHPHIGLVALSYLLDGHLTHRDNLGSRSELGPGDLGCTIAGRGVVHSERFERLRLLGGRLELFQVLVALPDGHEACEPRFEHVREAQVPTQVERGAVVRSLDAAVALPARLLLRDVRLEPGARHVVADDAGDRAIYVIAGRVAVDEHPVDAQHVALLDRGEATVVATTAAHILVYGGDSPGPRYMWWNYISSSLEPIEEARQAWREGRVALPAGDTESFTPAPPDSGRPLLRINAIL